MPRRKALLEYVLLLDHLAPRTDAHREAESAAGVTSVLSEIQIRPEELTNIKKAHAEWKDIYEEVVKKSLT